MIYLDHFGLREAPFRITPHTEFFFDGAKRGATLEALIYAITHDEGIVKVSGEVGSGKTMLCRMLLEKLPENVVTVYLANPLLSREEILSTIAEELAVSLGEGSGRLRVLQEKLLEIYAAGRQVVVLIDEAHAMPPEALEEIRLLSNLESNRHKLLQIVLFGQPELDQRLGESAMRQLNDRITHKFALAPLRRDDVGKYLLFRLRAAGYRGPDLLTRGAIYLIGQASQGLTRRINILADKALLAAFSDGVHQIGRRQVRAAIRDAQFQALPGSGARWRWPAAVAVGLCLTAVVAYLAGSRQLVGLPTAVAPAAAVLPATVAAPPPTPVAKLPTGVAVGAGAISPVAPPQATREARPEAASRSATQPSTLDERIAATDAWLARTPDSHYFIQLLVADAGSRREVEAFIADNEKVLDAGQLRVYRSQVNGRQRLGVIYGDYPTRELADAALAKLATIHRANNPYARQVGRLR